MPLTADALAREIQAALEEDGKTIPLRNIKDSLSGLAQVAEEQVAVGEDFTVPGVARLTFRYTPARAKGEAYKKGETYVGFGGVEQTAEQDSPARKAKVRLVAAPTGAVAKRKPRSKPAAQSAFLKSKAGKAVVARKG